MLEPGYYNMDGEKVLEQFPDKFFEIAVVDPPYFSGPEKRGYYGRAISPIGVQRHYEPSVEWKVPDRAYFDYPFGSGRIVWDKCNGASSFSDCEIAYCSLHDSVRLFRYMWNGMMQGRSIREGHIQQGNKRLNEKRIHPTQKPVNLYRWIVRKYIKSGWKVLDTYVGSASSLIAYHEARLDFWGFEKDKHMYGISKQRYEEETAQVTIFELEGEGNGYAAKNNL